MEDKLLQYERTKRSLQRHGGNLDLVQAETELPMQIILDVRSKMSKELRKMPEKAKVFVAENTFWMIYDGVQERKQILRDLLESLHKREQVIVCTLCETEIFGETGAMIEYGMCPKCNKMVHRSKRDRLDIIDCKRSILKQEAAEDKMAAEYASKLFAIKNMPRGSGQSNKDNTPMEQLLEAVTSSPTAPLGIGFTGDDAALARLYKNMTPPDRQLFAEKLMERMTVIDAEIVKKEKENESKPDGA